MELIIAGIIGGVLLAVVGMRVIWIVGSRAVDNGLDWLIHNFGNERAAKGSSRSGKIVSKAPVHHGKYVRLFDWLRRQQGSSVIVSFNKIEDILGFPLPPSSRRYIAHWYGYDGSAVARAIADAGWKASDVNLTAERVTFVRQR